MSDLVHVPGCLRGVKGLAACALLALSGLAVANSAGDDRQGTFKAVEGEVTIVHGDARRAATVGGPLREGTVIALGPQTVLDMKRVQYDGTTQGGNLLLDLLRGSLRVVTGLIAKTQPKNMEVTTPTSIIGVRGTDFIVEANP